MKREIARSGDLKGSRCCPGHDKWPNGRYKSRRSTKARARSKQLEHQSARARVTATTRKEARLYMNTTNYQRPSQNKGNDSVVKITQEEFIADIGALVAKHGCAHFLNRKLEPAEQLQGAIDQLKLVADGSAERACLRDLRKLLKKIRKRERREQQTGHQS